jgi:hypothetical protein
VDAFIALGRFIIKDIDKGAGRVIMERSSGVFRTTAYKPFPEMARPLLLATFRHSPALPHLEKFRPCAVTPLTARIDVIIERGS